ncbi:MAG: ATPase, T2SS/T4P/T4SS family [Armatimonadota bacterium]
MKCEEIRDEMVAYLKGELSDKAKQEIDEHLARCQGCRRELEQAQKLLVKTLSANESSIVDLADSIIQEAVQSGASDIHLNPVRDGADILLRIDGVLCTIRHLSVQERDALVARYKMMGGIPTSESRIPQDGRMLIKLNDVDYDLRISVMPFLYGEKVVARVLDRGISLPTLDGMGFLPEQLDQVRKLIKQPCGALYVSGPTGSGKTSVLYSILQELINPEISIMTIEDPIEMVLTGVQQASVDRKEGLTFASALRAFFRQDPDIIMAGEIRDYESLELLIAGAITGHFMLSTLHTQHAVDVPQRLLNVGADPFMVSDSMIGVISSVLARIICPQCKEEYEPSTEALRWLGLTDMVGKTKFYHGAGCDACRGGGYKGRIGLHEVLVFDNEMYRMVNARQVDPNMILRCAIEHGFITMIEVARKRVLEGITTPEELFRLAHLITSGLV